MGTEASAVQGGRHLCGSRRRKMMRSHGPSGRVSPTGFEAETDARRRFIATVPTSATDRPRRAPRTAPRCRRPRCPRPPPRTSRSRAGVSSSLDSAAVSAPPRLPSSASPATDWISRGGEAVTSTAAKPAPEPQHHIGDARHDGRPVAPGRVRMGVGTGTERRRDGGEVHQRAAEERADPAHQAGFRRRSRRREARSRWPANTARPGTFWGRHRDDEERQAETAQCRERDHRRRERGLRPALPEGARRQLGDEDDGRDRDHQRDRQPRRSGRKRQASAQARIVGAARAGTSVMAWDRGEAEDRTGCRPAWRWRGSSGWR